MRRLSHRVLPVSVALVTMLAAACASTGTAPVESASGTQQSTVRMDGGGATAYQAQLTHNDRAAESDLAVSADRAFAVLPAVYEQLGLKINTAVTDTRTVGVSAMRMRRLGKESLSRFLTCGADATGASLADTYAVTMTVLSRVTPTGTTGAVLSTQVLGSAQPISTSGTTVTCQSTGVLEDRIAKTTALRTAA